MSIAGIRDITATPVGRSAFDAGLAEVGAPERSGGDDDENGFGVHFKNALGELERTTAQADATSEGLVTGEVDIHEAMVAMEKADLVLRVAGTVRNKVIDAYQQLMQVSGS